LTDKDGRPHGAEKTFDLVFDDAAFFHEEDVMTLVTLRELLNREQFTAEGGVERVFPIQFVASAQE